MADIAKCPGTRCPQKQSCYRYLAPEEDWQEYMSPEFDGTECEYYWPTKEKKHGKTSK